MRAAHVRGAPFWFKNARMPDPSTPHEHAPALIVVQTTLPDEKSADALARALVEGGLAACVQASAITSTYRWEGGIERANETRLDIKTTAARLGALLARLRADHPYDEPELVVLPVAWASEGYRAWVAAETG